LAARWGRWHSRRNCSRCCGEPAVSLLHHRHEAVDGGEGELDQWCGITIGFIVPAGSEGLKLAGDDGAHGVPVGIVPGAGSGNAETDNGKCRDQDSKAGHGEISLNVIQNGTACYAALGIPVSCAVQHERISAFQSSKPLVVLDGFAW
jgi:hypothetical protein